MTNQLLLAQVLAAGFDWDYLWHWTHDSDAWKAVLPASATVIAAAIAVIGVGLTARKATQQMELSKQGTPPELTRYKTWVEISEKYKELMEFERFNSFENTEKEYQEIRASRKAALDRAVWERKIFANCPNLAVQKLLMQISPSKIFRIVNTKAGESISSSDAYIHSRVGPYFISLLIWVIPFIALFGSLIFSVLNGDRRSFWASSIAVVCMLIVAPIFCEFAPYGLSGAAEATYYFRKILVSHGWRYEVNLDMEASMMAKQLRYSIFVIDYLQIIYCPWESKNAIMATFMKIVTYFIPGYYVRKGFKNKDSVLWGSYKEELLNGDLKEKLGREDTQAPNSDTQEETQPTHP
ncbi:hypothetical protein [Rothia mucilaginosa]|uniref:hypothetical protein n=1 Tax=Rothia mucilaginosa TaxID=43675 RepID=UPI0028E22195|nr:hypothetical protein [Rothia mucilaginosa]